MVVSASDSLIAFRGGSYKHNPGEIDIGRHDEITAINEDLAEDPELVNREPYGEGWLCRIRPDDPSDFLRLLDEDAYEATLPEN